MRVLLCCLGLLFAAPASANSLVDALCGAPSTGVLQMPASEKLCRSFALALPRLPAALSADAQAMLTPENIATMVALTGAWLGTQGIPIVGQAVDAALLALGVTLLALQSAEVIDSLWKYANQARAARTYAELDAAASVLARAISTAGLNVVAIVLTRRALGKVRPGPPRPAPLLVTPQGTTLTTAAASGAIAPTAAMVGVLSQGTGEPLGEERPATKSPDPKAFEQWISQAEKMPVRGNAPASRFQVAQAGSEEFVVSGGGVQVRADGARVSDAHLLEVKHIDTPDTSPYVPGSRCNAQVRELVRKDLLDQFTRYARIIRDPSTPAVGLEVITNDARAASFFEALLKEAGTPSKVVVRP
jgi:hypothetical protein